MRAVRLQENLLNPSTLHTDSTRKEIPLTFISWAPDCSRSDSIAARLGGRSHMVYSSAWGSRYSTVLFKYLVQSLRTLWILVRERPRVVLVMAPPVVTCLPVWLYCLLAGARFAIDAHTGAFLNPRWRRLQWLQRFFSRRASTTIVTNDHLRQLVEGWGASATIVADVPVVFPQPKPVPLPPGCHMTLVCSYCRDEPLDEFFEAARQIPDVTFHVTGDDRKLDPELRARAPENVRFTGFLSGEEYVGQLLASDAVIALTSENHTMQRGAYEAIYLGRPVITSDFPILRESFAKGAVHVDPVTDDIVRGVAEMRANLQRLRQESEELRLEKTRTWDAVAGRLAALWSTCPAGTSEAVRSETAMDPRRAECQS